jgi:hypothetical protein
MEIPTQQKTKIVNDIDGDGDDDDDENGEGIKYYLKMVLCFKDLPFLKQATNRSLQPRNQWLFLQKTL